MEMTRPSDEAWEEVKCILCGKHAATRIVWPDIQRGNIVRCLDCGLVFRNPRLKENVQTRHFEGEWTESRPAVQLEAYRTKILKSIVDWILRRRPEPGAILDIGSSYGNLLAQFPETWERFGIEPSMKACQIAQRRLPEARIIKGTLATAKIPEKAFDIITLVDSIYYFHYPVRDLSRLPDLLKPKGMVLIEAPNFANRGPVYRWMGHPFDDTWMYFYTPSSLERILNLAGLKVVERIDLPGHQIGSSKFLPRSITWSEFAILKTLRKLSGNRLDLVPHFVLVAQRMGPFN
jgi:SAM-dependent methyltransferase